MPALIIVSVVVGVLALAVGVLLGYRSKVRSGKGQVEAATALNMDKSVMMRRIILPQAFLLMLPPWGNLSIELLKLTALVSLITITDLTFTGFQLNQTTLRTTEIFSLLLVMYLSLSLLITFGIRGLERRAARGHARGRAA